jgi:hypothetical protein
MIPPGIPDFLTRARLAEAGTIKVSGRAWVGRADITRVEFSADGGTMWEDATLEPPVGPFAWRGWSIDWKAEPGIHTLCARASDSTGRVQPDNIWNAHGMANNAWQRVEVIVEDGVA